MPPRPRGAACLNSVADHGASRRSSRGQCPGQPPQQPVQAPRVAQVRDGGGEPRAARRRERRLPGGSVRVGRPQGEFLLGWVGTAARATLVGSPAGRLPGLAGGYPKRAAASREARLGDPPASPWPRPPDAQAACAEDRSRQGCDASRTRHGLGSMPGTRTTSRSPKSKRRGRPRRAGSRRPLGRARARRPTLLSSYDSDPMVRYLSTVV